MSPADGLSAVVAVLLVAGLHRIYLRHRRLRELERFDGDDLLWAKRMREELRELLLLRRKTVLEQPRRKRQSAYFGVRLQQAGLESPECQEAFYLLLDVAPITALVTTAALLSLLPLQLSGVAGAILLPLGFYGPTVWLHTAARERRRAMEREFGYTLYLLQLGMKAGWHPLGTFERIADAYRSVAPKNELSATLQRAKWVVAAGGTWRSTLYDLGSRIGSPFLTRGLNTVISFIDRGSNEPGELEQLTRGVERSFRDEVDSRVSAVLIAMIVALLSVLAGFALLFIPLVFHT